MKLLKDYRFWEWVTIAACIFTIGALLEGELVIAKALEECEVT